MDEEKKNQQNNYYNPPINKNKTIIGYKREIGTLNQGSSISIGWRNIPIYKEDTE